MNPLSKQLAAFSIGAALIASAASAQIVSEAFGGLNADNLDGTSADIFSAAITTAGGSSTWSAASGFKADGAMVGNGSAFLDLGTYINDTKGQTNGVFTLSATVVVTAGSWGSLGFLDTPTTGTHFANGSGEGTWLYRDGGDLDMFGGPGSSNSEEGPNVTDGSSQLLTLVLDLSDHNGTTNFGSVSFYHGTAIPANLEHTYEYGSDRSFNAIGMTGTGSPNGSYSDLTLTQVPEPSSFALLAGCFGLAWIMVRRRS